MMRFSSYFIHKRYPDYAKIRLSSFISGIGIILILCTPSAFARQGYGGDLKPSKRVMTYRRGKVRSFKRPNPIDTRMSPDQKAGLYVMETYLKSGLKQPYIGEQVSQIYTDGTRESTQIVKHLTMGKEKIIYLKPPALEGETLLMNQGMFFNYRPKPTPAIDEGYVPFDRVNFHIRSLLKNIRSNKTIVRIVGNEIVAGQPTTIIEIRPKDGGTAYKRFWIDERTGVRLKNENLDKNGRVLSSSYFIWIKYSPTFNPKEFTPASLPKAPRVPVFPETPPLNSIEEARIKAGYPIKVPAMKPGYKLNGIWVTPNTLDYPVTILRYTDGVNYFALFEHPFHPGKMPFRLRKAQFQKIHFRPGAAIWVHDNCIYTIVGNLRRETIQEIYNSLK
jgi:hypothetical protein